MTGSDNENWESLGREWQRHAPPVPGAADIRRRLRRKRARLLATWLMDLVLAAGLAALVIRELLEGPDVRTWAWISALGVFLAIAVAFTVVNRRGLWVRESASLDAYVRHGLEHCRRRLRTIRFAWGLYAAEVLFIAGYGIGVGLSAGAWMTVAAVLGAFTAGFVAWTLWFGPRVKAEQRYLEALAAHESTNGGHAP